MKKKKNVLQSLGSCHLTPKTGASKSGWAPSALPPVSFHRLCHVPAAATAQRWLWSTGVVDRVLGQSWGSWPSFRKSRAGRSWRPRLFGDLCGILGSIPEHSGSPRDQTVGPMAGSQTQASVHSQAGWRHQSGSIPTQWVCRRRHQKPCPTSSSGHLVLMWVSRGLICMNIWDPFTLPHGLPGGLSGEESAHQGRRCKRCQFSPWVGKIPWRRKWLPTPVFLPGASHGQRSLVGYSPWAHKSRTQTNTLYPPLWDNEVSFPCTGSNMLICFL